jgi:hypothetical protein
MSAPSWSQLAAIPHSVTKDATLRALAIDVPPQGVARVWCDRGLRIEYCANPQGVAWWTVYDAEHPDPALRGSPRMCMCVEDVARAVRWVAGTPTGDALRRWLAHYGYVPPNARAAAPEPQQQTKTII